MKRAGSPSSSSRDSQAAGVCTEVSQVLTSVDFPKPAGAEISMSLQPLANPSFSCLINRGRGTKPGRGEGMYNFVVRIGADILKLIIHLVIITRQSNKGSHKEPTKSLTIPCKAEIDSYGFRLGFGTQSRVFCLIVATQVIQVSVYLTLDVPYCHHENWEDAGYPRALKGEEVPRIVRIFALVGV